MSCRCFVGASDYSVSVQQFSATADAPDRVVITLNEDSIGQEDVETFELRLTLVQSQPPANSLFQDTMTIVIRDTTSKFTASVIPCTL